MGAAPVFNPLCFIQIQDGRPGRIGQSISHQRAMKLLAPIQARSNTAVDCKFILKWELLWIDEENFKRFWVAAVGKKFFNQIDS